MKKTRFMVCLALIVMILAQAPALAEISISLEEIYRGNNVHMASGNAFMTAKFNNWVLMDEYGNEVNGNLYDTLWYSDIEELSCFLVGQKGAMGLLGEDGRLILPCKYDSIECYSADWAAGLDKAKNNIDVYFQGVLVASLDGASIKNWEYAQAYNKYLYFSRPGSGIVCVDQFGGVLRYDRYYYSNEYNHDSQADTYFHPGSGQTVFSSSCTLTEDDVKCPYLAEGRVILDLQGNIVGQKPDGVSWSSLGAKAFHSYVEVTGKEGKGLVDCHGNVVLEPVYDEINQTPNALGSFAVKKGNQIQFVDLQGNTLQSIDYFGSRNDIGGWYSAAFLVFSDLSGKIVFTPKAGQLRFEGAWNFDPQNSHSLITKAWNKTDGSYSYGLLDIYGNMLLPAEYNDVDINANGTLVYAKQYSGTNVLYRVVYAEVEEPQEEASVRTSVWVCPVCGQERTSNFCPDDATPRQ